MQSFLTAEKFIVTAKLTFESRHVVADHTNSKLCERGASERNEVSVPVMFY